MQLKKYQVQVGEVYFIVDAHAYSIENGILGFLVHDNVEDQSSTAKASYIAVFNTGMWNNWIEIQ